MSTPTAPGSRDPTQAASPARLLLAEDDFELRELLACVLRADGHEVVEASDGNELWELLSHAGAAEQPAFSLVVSDVRMPGLSTFEILSRLQRALAETPIILITAFGDRPTHLRALRLGASRVLNKPFDCDELRSVVQETLLGRTLHAS